MNSSGNIIYIYDATGVKLKKITTEGSSSTTEYAGNYVYKNGTLEFFNHAEGIVEHEADGYKYVYQYKDHLGNIRLSYKDADKDGAISQNEIIQEKNYYPFGLEHEGYNTNLRGRNHNYGFGNKEEQNELDLNWIDITARNYDPAIGRWMNIDPLADQMRRHSPYNYAFDSPLRFIDPDGMSPLDVIITGSFSQEAFDQLQASVDGQLDLSMKDGKVTATVSEGVELEEGGAAETLLNATTPLPLASR